MYKKNQSILPESEQNQWFSTWFNTPFYHLLYNKRNLAEAESFILNLIYYLNPAPESLILDLACGAGRHAITLNKSGLNVLGVDLSVNSIIEAKKFENETLHFKVQDMREVFLPFHFDYIFNLFTSFGYFETQQEDENVLKACHQQLKPKGILILDYFNTEKILTCLPYKGMESKGNIDFLIEKKYSDNRIIKTINFNAEGKDYFFEEHLAAYTLNDLERMFDSCGFKIKNEFGNYALEKYRKNSDRVIIIAEKN